jgi:MFS family permease
MGAFLPELFPTRVRYTGASITYNLGGILGASFAPYIAQSLANRGGLRWVGAYLAIACLVSFVAVLLLGETAGADLAGPPSNGRAAIQAAPLAADAAGVISSRLRPEHRDVTISRERVAIAAVPR